MCNAIPAVSAGDLSNAFKPTVPDRAFDEILGEDLRDGRARKRPPRSGDLGRHVARVDSFCRDGGIYMIINFGESRSNSELLWSC